MFQEGFGQTADAIFKLGAGCDLISVYLMDWLLEANETVSMKIWDLVSVHYC